MSWGVILSKNKNFPEKSVENKLVFKKIRKKIIFNQILSKKAVNAINFNIKYCNYIKNLIYNFKTLIYNIINILYLI